LKRIFSPLLEQEFYLIKEFEARRLASEKIAFNCYGRYRGSGLAFGAFLSLKILSILFVFWQWGRPVSTG